VGIVISFFFCWESHGFLEDSFFAKSNRGDWIGFVGNGKNEWKLLVTSFFFATSFFASGFLLQMDFAIIDLNQF